MRVGEVRDAVDPPPSQRGAAEAHRGVRAWRLKINEAPASDLTKRQHRVIVYG